MSQQPENDTTEKTPDLSQLTPTVESTVETPVEKLGVGALVPQPHGGALRQGGTNKGGPGRPRDIVRAAALKAYAERLPLLGQLADGVALRDGKPVEMRPQDQIKALDLLGRTGLGTENAITAGAEFSNEDGVVRFTLTIGDAAD